MATAALRTLLRPRIQADDLATLATLATLPDFVDPDEAVVSSWCGLE